MIEWLLFQPRTTAMTIRVLALHPAGNRSFPRAGRVGLGLACALLAFSISTKSTAQVSPGPYSNYNWNANYGLPYYNQGYAQYGFPGVGVSPWDPIVNA